MEDLEEFKASKEQGFNPTDRLLNLLINSSGGVTVAQVAELIKQNAQVNKCDPDGRGAALIWALVMGVKLEVLEILLKASGTFSLPYLLRTVSLSNPDSYLHQMIWDPHVYKIIINK